MLIFDRDPGLMFLRALVALLVAAGTAVCQECQYQQAHQFDYSQVFALERSDNFESFVQLPGHTRSRYQPKYGLIAPESRVWAASGAWPGCKTAHLLSDNGSHFSMYLVVVISLAANMSDNKSRGPCRATTAHAKLHASCTCSA